MGQLIYNMLDYYNLTITQDCFLVVMLGILAKDERIINFTYIYTGTWNISLELVFVSLIMLIDYSLSLTNVNVLSQGNLELGQGKVREKSGNFSFYDLWEPCNLASLCS